MTPVCQHGGMKRRLQIQLDPQDYEALRSWARWRAVSMSAAVRWLIREKLVSQPKATDPRIERFLAAAGTVSSAPGEGEVSVDHDRHLYGDPEA